MQFRYRINFHTSNIYQDTGKAQNKFVITHLFFLRVGLDVVTAFAALSPSPLTDFRVSEEWQVLIACCKPIYRDVRSLNVIYGVVVLNGSDQYSMLGLLGSAEKGSHGGRQTVSFLRIINLLWSFSFAIWLLQMLEHGRLVTHSTQNRIEARKVKESNKHASFLYPSEEIGGLQSAMRFGWN